MVKSVVELTKRLIAIPSVSPDEFEVGQAIHEELLNLNWPVEVLPIDDRRFNLFVPFGVPKVVLTTHMDVVAASAPLFSPQIKDGRIYGRGACDTKGIIASMIAGAFQLRRSGVGDFGLLFVVGEEDDGIGARSAVTALKNRGIEFIINGEPTEGKLATSHKGALDVVLRFEGRSCHSGYPELGIDANRAMILCASKLLAADFGSHPVFGDSSINLGYIQGGAGANIISAHAEMRCCVRTVGTDNSREKAVIEKICSPIVPQFTFDTPPVECFVVPGFEAAPMSYGSDLPNFLPLGCKMLMYGPGTILVAHTDDEHIVISDLEKAVSDYAMLTQQLLSVET